MILNTFGCPHLGWSGVSELCSRTGVEHGRVMSSSLIVHPPTLTRILGDLRVVYLDSFEVMKRWVSRFNRDARGNVLVLGLSEVELRSCNLPVRQRVDLLDLVSSMADHPSETVVCQAEDPIATRLDGFHGISFIGNLHNAFYRITDKSEREAHSRVVYEYLAGLRKRPPATFLKKVETVLRDPRTAEFIRVCKEVADNPASAEEIAERSGFDSFEVLFTLKKSGSL